MLFFIIPGIVIALNYAMIYFVIVDNPEIGVMEALKKSKQIMNGHRIQYIILNLSFLGWYVLYYIILIILLFLDLDILYSLTSIALILWLAPYILVTQANFYNQIKDED